MKCGSYVSWLRSAQQSGQMMAKKQKWQWLVLLYS
jgi:hypothetical protein